MLLKILAVDDETQVLEVVKAMVEPLGIEVETSSDSVDVSQRVDNEVFDGFLLDARMPFVDGFQLTERIRKSRVNAQVPIAMLTGYDDVETMRRGFRAGVTFFVGKPFTRERAASLCNVMRGIILREKRRHARLPFRTPVEGRWGQAGENVYRGGSLNVGEGGMLLEPAGGVHTGDELVLEFRMPNSKKALKPRAKVVREENPNRIAVQFTNIDLGDQETIHDYVFGRTEE